MKNRKEVKLEELMFLLQVIRESSKLPPIQPEPMPEAVRARLLAELKAKRDKISQNPNMKNRKEVLLRAAYDMLRKCADATYVISPMETTVYYDETNCDGMCLMEDIAQELNIEEDTEPLAKHER